MSRLPDRGLRAAVRLPLGRAREPRRLDRLAVLSPLRQPVGVRANPRRRRRALVDPPGRRHAVRDEPPVRRRHPGAGDDVHDRGRLGDAHRRAGRRPQRTRSRPRRRCGRAPCCAGSSASTGSVDFELSLRAATRVRTRLAGCCNRWRAASPPGAGPTCCALSSPVPLEIDGSTAHAHGSRCAPVRRCRSPCSTARTSEQPPRCWTQTEIRDRLDDTAEAWRTWSSLHQDYDGPWADLVRLERPRAVRADVLPDGRDRGRADHVAPGGSGRLAQLGLPLLVGPRRVVHAAGPVGRRLSPRGRTSSSTTSPAPRRHRSARVPTSRSCSASAASTTSPSASSAISPAGGTARRCASATARGTSASSTCTASCSTPPTDCPTSSTGSGRSTRSLPRRPGRHRRRSVAGAGPRHLGDPGRAPPLPLLASSCAGWRSTVPSRWPTASTRVDRVDRVEGRPATRSPTPS